MEREPNIQRGRETILTLTLVIFLGGLIIFFLNFVSFGFFTYVLGAVLAFTVVGFLHYVLWGYAMTQEVAGEREEALLQEKLDAELYGDAIQDLSRPRRY